MIQFEYRLDIPDDFSGVCKVLIDGSIRYYQNGLFHREDGPAIIFSCSSTKMWYYRGKFYGKSTDFNCKTWTKFAQALKYKESLEIFK